MKYIMALDQGTTSCRSILFDKQGNICAMAQEEFTQHYPKPGWVEHDASEIWEKQLRVARASMEKLGVSAADIAAIGITNQRETTVVWDKVTGEPVAPAIVWQCRRTAPEIARLEELGWAQRIRKKTGLIPDAYFSGTKIRWILENTPDARERAERGELLFGTIDTWLIWKLTGGKVHVTDYTNASRTMLFNIHELCWDAELTELLEIPASMLPEAKPSSCVYGETEESLFGGAIPVSGAAGDQQAALFGQCCFEAGDVKNTYGTGCFLLMNTGEKAVLSKNGLLTTIAATPGERVQYALEGSIFIGGAVIQWLRDELGLIEKSADSERFALQVKDTNGVYLVPAFTGLGAPWWDSAARGTIVGLTRGANRCHIIRAALEAIAYQSYDVCAAMSSEPDTPPIRSLKADGGASKNGFLMQLQSDVLGVAVSRPACVETTALGAAYLAGLAVGYWKDIAEIRENYSVEAVFTPTMEERERKALLDGWHKAVRCAIQSGKDE